MQADLASILTDRARGEPARVALKFDDVALSYGELDGASARVAALLRAKGIEAGARVGVLLPIVPTSSRCTTASCAPARSSCRSTCC
jgi:long-chain acyl-CoA synthetase